MSNLPVAFLLSGTRGDIQPLLALALRLRATGRVVRVVTHARFAPLIAAHQLPCAELDGDLSALLMSPEHRAALIYDGHPIRTMRESLRYLRAARGGYRRMLDTAWRQCQGAGLLVGSLPTAAFAGQIAAALDIPLALALLQPASPTAAFPSPLLPLARSLGALNRLSHRLIELLLWLPWQPELRRWEQRHGLPAPGWRGPFAAAPLRAATRLYGFSPLIVPRPPDWPATQHVTGYWFLDRPSAWEPPADLAAFLAAGPPPVAVGFGSMGMARRADLVALAASALHMCGQRGIIAVEDGALGLIAPGIFAIRETWHDWLFPQVAAVVHHAGAGTTAAALRAGAPSVPVPVGVDQHFWGGRIAAVGAGVPPIPQPQLTAERLAHALGVALSGPVRAQAARIGEQIRAEDGVGTAVARLLAL
jgi:sterol 3beta-glucosyltransferase